MEAGRPRRRKVARCAARQRGPAQPEDARTRSCIQVATAYHLDPQHELCGEKRKVVEMGTNKDWVVRLGREEWERHTYERPAADVLHLLGSVAHGAAIGALATDKEGNYLQVNGDHISPLNAGHLRRAVAAAKTTGWAPPGLNVQEPSRAPVVVIKRRRLVPAADASKTAAS
jgi:hypothetical protein